MAKYFWYSIIALSSVFILISIFPQIIGVEKSYEKNMLEVAEKIILENKPSVTPLNKEEYDKKIEILANNPLLEPIKIVSNEDDVSKKQTIFNEEVIINSKKDKITSEPILWPVKTSYPNDGAILPFRRVIAYYGNLYSKKMGALGEYEEEEMLNRLEAEVKKWELADPQTPIVPALHYIAVTAQLSPGGDGKHRLRMPDKEIEKVLAMAEKINAIVFLDIQVGFSTLQAELPVFEKYLKMPNVHLGIDPEFSMKGNIRPGKVVGTFDAVDVNYATDFLAKIVKENNLTPKILVIHRYTQKMLTNYKNIKTRPEVQIVIHMDGWGTKAKKINTYKQFVYKEPVQFTGFKIFYKNDILEPGTVLFSPEELLKLSPIPIYIQYQ